MKLFGKLCCKLSKDGPDTCVSFYKDDTTNKRQIQITDNNISCELLMNLTAKISPCVPDLKYSYLSTDMDIANGHVFSYNITSSGILSHIMSQNELNERVDTGVFKLVQAVFNNFGTVTVEYAKTGYMSQPPKEKTADDDWPTSSIIAVVNKKRATISARYDGNNNILIKIPIDIMDWPASFIWSLASELQTRFGHITAELPKPLACVVLKCSEPIVDMYPDAIPKVNIEDVVFDIKELIGRYGNVLCVKCNTDTIDPRCTLCPPRTLSYRLLYRSDVMSIVYKQTTPWQWYIEFPGSQNNAYWWDLVHHCAMALQCPRTFSTMYLEDGMYKIQLDSSQIITEKFIQDLIEEGIKGFGTVIKDSSNTQIPAPTETQFPQLIFKLKDGCAFAIHYEQTVKNGWRILLPDYRKKGSPVRDEYIATCEDILTSLCKELDKLFSLISYDLKDIGARIVCEDEDEGDTWRVNAICMRTAIFNGMREYGTFISCS